jgi:hypothetical protein
MMSRPLQLLFAALLLAASAQAQTTSSAQDKNEEFFAAVRHGDVAAAKALLDRGVDVNAKTRYGATALSFASDRDSLEMVNLLLERGADVNVKDTFYNATPMIWAVQKGHAEIVKALLDRGATGKEFALSQGVNSENVAMVKVALDKGGFSPETLTNALSGATRKNNAELIEMLKKAGAKPAPPANFQVDADTLKSYAGNYKSEQVGEVTFDLKDGKLIATVPGQPPNTLGAVDKTTFRILEFDGITITFKSEGGKVVSFTLKRPDGATFEFKKVEQKQQ